MLVRPRVPDEYVKTTVTAKIDDRLATLQEQILSRSRLERIILDLNLYERSAPAAADGRRRASACADTSTSRSRARNRSGLLRQPRRADSAEDDGASRVAVHRGEPARPRERRGGHEPVPRLPAGRRAPAASRAGAEGRRVSQPLQRRAADAGRRRTCRRFRTRKSSCRHWPNRPIAPASGGCCSSGRSSIFRRPIRCRSRRRTPATGDADDGRRRADRAAAPGGEGASAAASDARYKPDHPDVKSDAADRFGISKPKLQRKDRSRADAPVEQPVTAAAERLRQQRVRDLQAQIEDIDRQLAQKAGTGQAAARRRSRTTRRSWMRCPSANRISWS